MNSNSRCMRRTYGFFGRASIAAGTRLVCLAAMKAALANRKFPGLHAFAVMAALLCAGRRGAAANLADPAHADAADAAKARLAAVRARIAELTDRIGAELKQRDALGARVREADLLIAAK